ncbi:MAG TPA: hypothetical protein VIV60_13115, partial [Polyangiaceae bacterium]
MKSRWFILSAGLAIACGNTDGNSSSPSAGGASSAGGTSNEVDASSGGKPSSNTSSTSSLPSAGGSIGTGGSANTNTPAQGGKLGTVVPGTPCTSNCPTGSVYTCYKEGCPLGACDNAAFYASAPCSTSYTAKIDDKTVFCAAGQNS